MFPRPLSSVVFAQAVALNCGAHAETAAAFYLPLTKVKRALELIQRGEKVRWESWNDEHSFALGGRRGGNASIYGMDRDR